MCVVVVVLSYVNIILNKSHMTPLNFETCTLLLEPFCVLFSIVVVFPRSRSKITKSLHFFYSSDHVHTSGIGQLIINDVQGNAALLASPLVADSRVRPILNWVVYFLHWCTCRPSVL